MSYFAKESQAPSLAESHQESSFVAGYVPSMEAIPFLEWAKETGFQAHSCLGYGNMVRGMLTGKLEAGLIPWEMFVSDLLSRPGQMRRWKIPAVMKACPMEVALNRDARRVIEPLKRRSQSRGSIELTFGVEGRHSFTKRQILAWLELIGLENSGRPSFKVLPMPLMIKALMAGEIDGFSAPSPWGLQAEVEGAGRLASTFNEGALAQHLVLACSESAAERNREALLRMPTELIQSNALKHSGGPMRRWSAEMAREHGPALGSDLFAIATKRYRLDELADEFVPNVAWLQKELDALVAQRAVNISPGAIQEVASALCMKTGS